MREVGLIVERGVMLAWQGVGLQWVQIGKEVNPGVGENRIRKVGE